MEKRLLGRTGHHSSVVVMGTAAFWNVDEATAHRALDLALAHGVNHIDIAPQYGNAQVVTGPWLEQHRDQFFVGCKTTQRTRDEAWADLQESLKILRTDVIDLYQFHAVTTMEELDRISAPGGQAEAHLRARDEGLVRWLGITSHGMAAPQVAQEAIRRFDLDTVMVPINPRLVADAEYRADLQNLLALCQARNVGVQVIKMLARGPWGDQEKTYAPWYEPYDQEAEIASLVRFALSFPGVTCVPSTGDVRLLPAIFRAAESFTPMSAAEQEALIAQRAGDTLIF